MIRAATSEDAKRISQIYNHYVTNSVITFEEIVVSDNDIADRMKTIQNSGLPWLVEELEGRVVGYAYATPWRSRSAYRFTVESAVYVDHLSQGSGTGSRLYAELFAQLLQLGFHSVMGMIALPNPDSIKLHQRLGFTQVGLHKEVGWKANRWIDVGVWQLSLGKR